MKINIPVRAVSRAQAATNTPVFDDDFQRISAADGADRASDHAERIATLTAGSGYEIFVEAQPFANQTADAIVGICAGADALVAACAFLQVEYEKALRLHQSLRGIDPRVRSASARCGAGFLRCARGQLLPAFGGHRESGRA